MSSTNKYSLVEGGIINKLFFVALPLIGTQIIQMAYNLTDMFWLGRLSSHAVAASGTVGLYLWLSMAFLLFGRMGAEIGVSQNIGRGDKEAALDFARLSIITAVALGVVLAIVYFFGRGPLVGFFGIKEAHVEQDARNYLSIVSLGLPFTFLAAAISGIFNGSGNTRISLLINGVGLVLNMALDPLLILSAGLGIRGAAIATVFAQAVAAGLSLIALLKYKNRPFTRIDLFKNFDTSVLKQIFKWVTPISIESFLFTFLTMLVAALVASYGTGAMAASRVGSQIESLTWLIAGGYASALTAFTGQNFGAGKWTRIRRGFRISTALMVLWGIIVGFILYFCGPALYKVFLPNNQAVVDIGAQYMRFLALVQIPGCLEGVAAGVFRGQGKTVPPSISSGTINALRVVLAFILTRYTSLGLTGIWIAIAAGTFVRGSWVFIWYLLHSRKTPKVDSSAIASL
jgi:putative MATE family efflux protein